MASPQRKSESDHSQSDQVANSSIGNVEPNEGYVEGFQRTERVQQEGAFKSIIQVLLAVVLFSGGLWLYWQHVQTQETVRELASQAKDSMLRDNPVDLAKAQKKLDEALTLDSSYPFVVVSKALINARLYTQFGIASAKDLADKFTAQAEDADMQKQERFGARGLLDVAAGKADAVEKKMVALVNKGGRGPAIFEAMAAAQKALGKSSAARKSLRSAADSEWRNPRYSAMTSELYLLDNDLKNAKNYVKKTLDANPNHVFGLLLEARVSLARDEEVKKAKDNIADVLGRPEAELNPWLQAYAHLAQSEFMIYDRKYKQAFAEAEQSIALNPKLADAYMAKGLALAHRGNAKALDSFKAGFELYPYSPRFYHLAALALLGAKQEKAALEVMNTWGEKATKDARFHVAFGDLLLAQGDENTAAAVKHYEAALKDDPESEEAYFHLAQVSQKARDFEKAVDYYNKAVGIREQFAEVYEGMGWLYAEQGHFNDAIPLFAKALTFFKAQHKSRRELNNLRKKVGEALKKNRKFRGYVKPWLKESRDLIR